MRIITTTGSSGGHIFPAVSFLDKLKEKCPQAEAILVLPRKSAKNNIIPEGFKIYYISTQSFGLKPNLKNLSGLFNFFRGSLESLLLLSKFKPDIVVGFGTIDCIPLVMLAWACRIKTIIHEQNVIPGKANRFLGKFVDKVAVSFIQTKDYLKADDKKIIVTGNPLRKGLKKIDNIEALDFFGFRPDKFTILVMGGSQGSHQINMAIPEALKLVSNRYRMQVIHISGAQDIEFLKVRYQDIGVEVKLFSFLKEIQYAYSASDMAICRSGATTAAELLFFKLPAIIIPYPFAYRHQFANARVLEEMNAAIVIKEDKLDVGALAKIIDGLLNDPEKIENMHPVYDNAHNFAADTLFTDAVLSLVRL